MLIAMSDPLRDPELDELVRQLNRKNASDPLSGGEADLQLESYEGPSFLPALALRAASQVLVAEGEPLAPGYRVLTHIPRLPENVIHRLVGELSGLEGIIRASQRDLEAVDGVGTVRAREIREGLRRLQEHNLVDRYLQL